MSGIKGNCNFNELIQLRDKLAQLENVDVQAFIRKVSKELAARLLQMAIMTTPVGVYPKETGKMGGTLRRGWTAKTEEEAQAGSGNGKDVMSYASSLPVKVEGNTFTITVINPVHYASYVEYGHRTRGGKGFVQGRFMLTKAEAKVEENAQKIIEKRLAKLIGDAFK